MTAFVPQRIYDSFVKENPGYLPSYRFSRHLMQAYRAPPAIQGLFDQFPLSNYILVNFYPDACGSISDHADDEPSIDSSQPIYSFSLGAVRTMHFKRKKTKDGKTKGGAPEPTYKLELLDGSLLTMAGTTQDEYTHGIPKEPKKPGKRYNLTCRTMKVFEKKKQEGGAKDVQDLQYTSIVNPSYEQVWACVESMPRQPKPTHAPLAKGKTKKRAREEE
jgi:hypothetical protein